MTGLPEIRSHILSMPGYEPVLPISRLVKEFGLTPETILKLDANENPYAPFDFIQQDLAGLKNSNRYPDPDSAALRSALSIYHMIPEQNILVGAGADDMIDLLCRLFADPGDVILNCPPTFGMYSFDADIQHARIVAIDRKPDFSIDIPAVEKAISKFNPKLLFVTSPNNPDGSLITPKDLERLLSLPIIVVLDEAYIEFAPPGSSVIRQVPQLNNLVVLRTFSKWAGLAGLRVGYGVFPQWMMEHLWKIKQPYNLSTVGEAAGIVSIQHSSELNRIAALLIQERELFYHSLSQIRWLKPYPSQANFILCRVVGRDAKQLKWELDRQGVFVRYFNKKGLTDCIRISVGRPQDTVRILKTLHNL